MKKLVTLIVIATFPIIATIAQTKYAQSCGNGCSLVTVESKTDRACGNNNDYTFTLTNNSNENLDIKLFAETPNGEWNDEGLLTDVDAGQTKNNCFWGCKLTGRTIIYYRKAGSRDVFPTQSELRGKARN